MAEKLKSLEILERPYLRNRLTDFYRTKTKSYRETSSIIMCGKESQRNNFEFSCDMPTIMAVAVVVLHRCLSGAIGYTNY